MWPWVTVQILQSELHKPRSELLGNKCFHAKHIWQDLAAPSCPTKLVCHASQSPISALTAAAHPDARLFPAGWGSATLLHNNGFTHYLFLLFIMSGLWPPSLLSGAPFVPHFLFPPFRRPSSTTHTASLRKIIKMNIRSHQLSQKSPDVVCLTEWAVPPTSCYQSCDFFTFSNMRMVKLNV